MVNRKLLREYKKALAWTERSVKRAFALCDRLETEFEIRCSVVAKPATPTVYEIRGDDLLIRWGLTGETEWEAFYQVDREEGDQIEELLALIEPVLKQDLADMVHSLGLQPLSATK